MKIKSLFLELLALSAIFVSCSKEPQEQEASLKLSPESVSFDAKASAEQSVSVLSNRDWKVAECAEWLSLTINGEDILGKVIPASSSPVVVSVTATPNTGMERRADIVFNGGTLAKKTLVVSQSGNVNYTAIEDVRALLGASTSIVVPDGTYIKGIVTSSQSLSNLTSNKALYIQDATAGINVFFAENHSFSLGDEIVLNISSVNLKTYAVMLELDGCPLANASLVSSGNTVAPKEVSIDDFIKNKYEGQYVAIKDVQVAAGDLSKTWVSGSSHTSISMVDKNSKTFVVYSGKYSTYGSEKVVQGSGTIKGIAGVYNDGIRLIFTQTSDWAGMTAERFDISTPKIESDKISVVVEASQGAEVTLKNATVVATALTTADDKLTFLVTDSGKADYLLVYNSTASGIKVGDNVTVKGSLTSYGGQPQIADGAQVTVNSNGSWSYPSPEDITAGFATFKSDKVKYISLAGTYTKSGNYMNIKVDGVSNKQASILKPQLIDMTPYENVPNCTFIGYYLYTTGSSTSYDYIMLTEVKTSTGPYLSIDPAEAKVDAKTTSASFSIKSNAAWTCTSKTPGFEVDVTSGSGDKTIKVTFPENTDTKAAKTGEIEIVASTITKTFTITQSKALDPSVQVVELANSDIVTAFNEFIKSSEYGSGGYKDLSITSNGYTWTGNMNVQKSGTTLSTPYIQIRNKQNACLKTPVFTKSIVKIEIEMTTSTANAQTRPVYAIPMDATFPSGSNTYGEDLIKNNYGSVEAVNYSGKKYTINISKDSIHQTTLVVLNGAAYFQSVKVYLQ